MKNTYVITKFDPLKTVVEECPRAGELLTEYGLHCMNCFIAQYDTIETAAQRHKMTNEEMDEMVDEINEQLEKEWKKL